MIIELNFPKTTTDLSGNKLGREIFRSEVEPNINTAESVEVVLPEQIRDVGASFVQGLYASLSEKYGKEQALEIMMLKCKNEEANKKIIRVINVYGV